MDLSLLTFLLVLSLAFANGANDVSKAIATLVGSGVADYRTAILWGTFWTTVGAGLSGLVATAMVKTFSQVWQWRSRPRMCVPARHMAQTGCTPNCVRTAF